MAAKRRYTQGVEHSYHSVRTPHERWLRAKKRADAEGSKMNHVLNEILEGYASGFIDLPRVTTRYRQARVAPTALDAEMYPEKVTPKTPFEKARERDAAEAAQRAAGGKDAS